MPLAGQLDGDTRDEIIAPGLPLKRQARLGQYPDGSQMTDSDDQAERLTRLEQEIQQVSARLAALEQPAPADPRPRPGRLIAALAADGEPGDHGGEEEWVSYSGQGRFGKDYAVMRQRGRLAEIRNADPDQAARVFAALASPARITLLQALLDGPRTSQQLRAELDDASVGQLYHHLRELLAAGLLTQPGRSQYALPRGSQIALCVQLFAATHLASGIPAQLPGSPGDGPPTADRPPAE